MSSHSSNGSSDIAERVAEALLYEGYLLFPYRRSSLKNQQRWTLGGIYPRAYSEASGGSDPWLMQTQLLVVGGQDAALVVKVRFLHVVTRGVFSKTPAGLHPVSELSVGDMVYRPWEEATEREIVVGRGPRLLETLAERPEQFPIFIPEGMLEEELRGPDGSTAGVTRHSWETLEGQVDIEARGVAGCGPSDRPVYRLTVRITNTTPWEPAKGESPIREPAARRSFAACHTILQAQHGEFISQLEPPDEFKHEVEGCVNIKTWPVLVGTEGERHTMLSSPIIAYDYPQISPESPGNLFDATEIDEILTLSILSLAESERQEMRESDPRGREILERTEGLTPDQLMGLHARVRSLQGLRGDK